MNDDTSLLDQLNAIQSRHHLTAKQLADYLGVSHGRMRHWKAGTRNPDSMLQRLIAVLSLVETMAPGVHEYLLPVRQPRGVGATNDVETPNDDAP